jgi:hypothetical protein
LAGAIVRSVAKLASITFLSLALSYWIDYLGFIIEGKLAAVLIIPSLGVPNWSVIYIINTAPSQTMTIRNEYHSIAGLNEASLEIGHSFPDKDFADQAIKRYALIRLS